MKTSRPKRKSADKAREKWSTPNIWSPQKGIQRNPAGYNAIKSRCRKRKLDFSTVTPNTQNVGTGSSDPTTAPTRYRKRKIKNWTKKKGAWNQKTYDKIQQRRAELRLQEKQRRVSGYKDTLNDLESLRARNTDNNFLWQVTVTFTLFATLLAWTQQDKAFTLCQIAAYVGHIVLNRPSHRVVLNLYNSWRLTRSFLPLFRGRTRRHIIDDYPMIKRKAVKWVRRRIIKRKKDEEAMTALQFMKQINSLFIRFNVYKAPGEHLTWSLSTATRYMHRLDLEFGGYSQSYCDGHEREDVLEARSNYIDVWYKLEPRMHLWIRQIEIDDDNQNKISWRHVDDFKLRGPAALNRDVLGEFGGLSKLGVEHDPDPNKRPLLVLANDECIFRTKRTNPKGWKVKSQNKLRPKDVLGTGRMLSGFAHEFCGFISLSDAELTECNDVRARRGDSPIEHNMFTLRAFDYGKNREVCLTCIYNMYRHTF